VGSMFWLERGGRAVSEKGEGAMELTSLRTGNRRYRSNKTLLNGFPCIEVSSSRVLFLGIVSTQSCGMICLLGVQVSPSRHPLTNSITFETTTTRAEGPASS
jgi:hypothetical protein